MARCTICDAPKPEASSFVDGYCSVAAPRERAGSTMHAEPCAERLPCARFTSCVRSPWTRRRRPALYVVGFIGMLVFRCFPVRLPIVAAAGAIDPSSDLIAFLKGLSSVGTQAGACLLTVESRDIFLADLLAHPSSAPTLRGSDVEDEWRAAHGRAQQQPAETAVGQLNHGSADIERQGDERRRCDDDSSDCQDGDAATELAEANYPLRAADKTPTASAEGMVRAPAGSDSLRQKKVAAASSVGWKSQPSTRRMMSSARVRRQEANETMAHGRELSTSCFGFVMYDSFGDGWQGAQYTFLQTSTSEIVASGSLVGAAQGTDDICLDRGCHSLQVTEDSWTSEVSWEFEGISGGSPFGPMFLSIADDGEITTFDDVCPTPAPTTSESPTASTSPTPTPTLSLAPTTPVPTLAPIETEAATFTQLQAAIAQAAAVGAKLIVELLADMAFAEALTIDRHVAIYSQGGVVLRGGGSRQLFRVEAGGQLTGANVTFRGGYSSIGGGAVYNLFGVVGLERLYIDGKHGSSRRRGLQF